MKPLKLLIIGAGPYGLSLAAFAKHENISFALAGIPMDFWKNHMPKDMRLRSTIAWHLDPFDRFTIQKYLEEKKISFEKSTQLSLEEYLNYVDWFQKKAEIEAYQVLVTKLEKESPSLFRATLEDGSTLLAENVVIATGYQHCYYIPPEYIKELSPGSYFHCSQFVDLKKLKNKTCAIIGGRQSAFEWGMLSAENGAKKVHLIYRHPTPRFAETDWVWTDEILKSLSKDSLWYFKKNQIEKEKISERLYQMGRLKLEPWLEPVLHRPEIKLWPNTHLSHCFESEDGKITLQLSSNETLEVDLLIFATGYKVNINKLSFLDQKLRKEIEHENNFPKLKASMESSVEGLYFTNLYAMQKFSELFNFTAAARVSATIIGKSIQE